MLDQCLSMVINVYYFGRYSPSDNLIYPPQLAQRFIDPGLRFNLLVKPPPRYVIILDMVIEASKIGDFYGCLTGFPWF